jgi:copper chaperone
LQTQTFKVSGMTCGGCVKSVTNAVKNVEAVGDVKVTLETGDVEVLYNPNMMTSLEIHDAVQEAVETAGFEVVATDKVEQEPRKGGCCCG